MTKPSLLARFASWMRARHWTEYIVILAGFPLLGACIWVAIGAYNQTVSPRAVALAMGSTCIAQGLAWLLYLRVAPEPDKRRGYPGTCAFFLGVAFLLPALLRGDSPLFLILAGGCLLGYLWLMILGIREGDPARRSHSSPRTLP